MPKKAAASGGKDRFGDLTNDLLRHVLSYLPEDDALQTCVLGACWRGLWRRATSLRFILDERSKSPHCERFEKLVKLVIHLRGDSPLVRCEISAHPDDETEGTYTHTTRLIEYTLNCQVKDLLVRAVQTEVYPLTFNEPPISQHLKTIELERVNLECSALNFSGCPVLEGLKMIHCWTYAHKISSESLKYLCITDFCSVLDDSHMRISTPALISLQLDDFHGLTPYLENMPFLVTAYVRLGNGCFDFTFCNINMEGDCDVPCCGCHTYPGDEGVLLNGLTHAVNLELIAEPEKIIYSWDLKRHPIFGNLKTLPLNEWFTTVDLICILQHSPVLEMLILQLGNTEKLIGTTGAQETVKESFVCAHLVVNIECGKVDEGIHEILMILSTCGVRRQQISINDPCSRSDCFSFQKHPAAAAASTMDGA